MQQHSIVTDGFHDAPLNERREYVGFVCPMPYRLRVGSRHSAVVTTGTTSVNMWFRNRIAIPEGTSFHDAVPGRLTALIFTEIVALLPTQSKGDIADLSTALQGLNYFVLGYAEAARVMFGGAPLRRLNLSDLFMANGWQVRVQAEDGTAWDPIVTELLALRTFADRTVLDGATGKMDDLPAEMLASIPEWIERCQDHLFHEFGFEAKAKMVGQDRTGALLMAVAALEGAHGAFVQEKLSEKLPAPSATEMSDTFLRELGMSFCNKLTPYLFMEPDQRPDPDLVKGAETALKFRNEILHALKARDGRYRHRLRTGKEIDDAYSAALKLYWHYRDAYYRITPPT